MPAAESTTLARGGALSPRPSARAFALAAFLALAATASLVATLGRVVLASGAPAAVVPATRLGGSRTHETCEDVRIIGASFISERTQSRIDNEGAWWLKYPLGEEVEGISVHYSHLVRNFLPSVVWCTRDESQKGQRPPGCYRVHMPFRKLREKHVLGMVQEATSKAALTVNGARVTFVNSSVEDPPAPPPRRSKHHQRNRGSSAESADAEIRSCAAPSDTKEAIYHPLAQLGASNACQFDKPGAQVIHVVRPNPLAKHPSEYTEAERHAAALRTVSNPEEVNAFLKRWAEDRGWTFATAEIDETWSVDDQASFFCDARVVFGIHGAGLMNIFWSNAGRNQGFVAAAAAAAKTEHKAEHEGDERKRSTGKEGSGFEASVGKIAFEAGDDDRAVSAPTRWIVDVAPGDATWFDDAAEAVGIVHVRSTTGHETHDESARLGEGDDGVDRLMGWTEVFVPGLEDDFRAAGVGEMAAAKEVPEREKEERARRAKKALKKRTQAHGFVV